MTQPTDTTRRHWLIGTATAAAAAAATTATLPAQAQQAMTPASPLGTDVPMTVPRTEFVYEAIVDIADMVNMGTGPLGERRIVPITGGEFAGPGLKGTVLPGGADRQLVRQDGARLLDALYELKPTTACSSPSTTRCWCARRRASRATPPRTSA